MTMVPAGNRAKRLSSVNLTTKTIHHHHFTRPHVNANNEVTFQRTEILPRSEISNRFEFISGLM